MKQTNHAWLALLRAGCLAGLLAGGGAWAADATLTKAWRAYSVCVAASMEDAVVRDMGEAQAELPQGRHRLPMPTWAVVELAKKGCQPFRESLAQAYERVSRAQRGEPLQVQEAQLFHVLQDFLMETQKNWQARGFYGPINSGGAAGSR